MDIASILRLAGVVRSTECAEVLTRHGYCLLLLEREFTLIKLRTEPGNKMICYIDVTRPSFSTIYELNLTDGVLYKMTRHTRSPRHVCHTWHFDTVSGRFLTSTLDTVDDRSYPVFDTSRLLYGLERWRERRALLLMVVPVRELCQMIWSYSF